MKNVLLLVCNGTEMYEAAAFFDVLGWAGSEGDTAVEVTVAGTPPRVRCTFGLTLNPDRLLAEIDPKEYDALAIPGGFEEFGFYEEAYSKRISDLILDFDARKKPIAAICTGALAVGRSGALAGKNATTYHLGNGVRRRQLADFGANVMDEKVVRDGHIITSTAPASAMEVAFQLLEMITSRHNADRIRHLMGFPSICRIFNYLKLSDRITTSGMPTEEEIPLIAQSGAEVVVSLVPEGVGTDLRSEPSLVSAASLLFERVPVDFRSPRVDDFESFCRVMEKHDNRRIHVHCEANMRVSVFMALYNMIVEGLPEDTAMSAVEEIWKPNETWQAFIQKVLQQRLRERPLCNSN